MRSCSCTSISTTLWNNRGEWTVYLKGYFWSSPVSVLRHFHRGLLPPPSNPTHWVRIGPGRRFDAHCVWSQDFNSFHRNAINQLELVNKAKWIGLWAGASNTNTNCVFYFWILPVANRWSYTDFKEVGPQCYWPALMSWCLYTGGTFLRWRGWSSGPTIITRPSWYSLIRLSFFQPLINTQTQWSAW